MDGKIVDNPYQILGVSPLASNSEITKAFGLAMKQRKYPADAIAKARKMLMNPDERIVADYLSPIIPIVKRFKTLDLNDDIQFEETVEEQLTIEQIDRLIQIEINKLAKEDLTSDSHLELVSLVWD
jgi:L-fucose mutarotase/ribose pyranase (RbsD/FucU family)